MQSNMETFKQIAQSLDGQLLAFDDNVKAETANIDKIKKALVEAEKRLASYLSERSDIARQYASVIELVEAAEDSDRVNERLERTTRIARLTDAG